MICFKKSFKCVLFVLAMVCFFSFPNVIAKAGTTNYTNTTISVNGSVQAGSTFNIKGFISVADNVADNVAIITTDSASSQVGETIFVNKNAEAWNYACPSAAGSYKVSFYPSSDGVIFDNSTLLGEGIVTVQVDDITVSCGAVSASATVDYASSQQTVTVQVADVVATAGVSTVTFIIYDANGNNVLSVNGNASGTSYIASIDAASLNQKYGNFSVKAVVTDVNGKTAETDANAGFTVVRSALSDLSVSANNTDATIRINTGKVYLAEANAKVKFQIWKDNINTDSSYYTAVANGDGTYSYSGSISHYNYKSGTYYVRSYVEYSDGQVNIFENIKSTTFKLSNYIVYGTTNDNFNKSFYIYNPTVTSSVKANLWSEVGKGKDKVSYNATYDSAKNRLVIKAKMSKLSGKGKAYLQLIDKKGKSIKKYSFNVKITEIVKTGWRYEKQSDGRTYKLYYKNGNVVTNLTSVLKLQKSGKLRAEVNRQKCRVTIYAYDKETKSWCIPVICFKCSPGKASTPTPTGTFKTSGKYRWHELMGPSWGQYCTRITGGVLFHSVAGNSYKTIYNLSAGAYNRLGNPASHGCVRLCVRDAKWIYDYCASGMQVKIFDSSYAGPITCQEVPKMKAGQKYDPTDPAAPKSKYNK